MDSNVLARALDALKTTLSDRELGAISFRCKPGGCPPTGTITLVPAAQANANLPEDDRSPLVIGVVNDLVRTPYSQDAAECVAHSTIYVQFSPRTFFKGKRARWKFTPDFSRKLRGKMPPGRQNRFEVVEGYGGGENTGGFSMNAGDVMESVIDQSGKTAVRLNLPSVAFNKGTVTVSSVDCPRVSLELIFEVPAVVVIDPGHGGDADVSEDDCTSENDKPIVWWPKSLTPQWETEKTLTLDLAKRVRNFLIGRNGRVKVVMTRTGDYNLGLTSRAKVAQDNAADVFISIHFNAPEKATDHAYGTAAYVHSGNPSTVAKGASAFAARVSSHTVAALSRFYEKAKNRPLAAENLAVLVSNSLGNANAANPVRAFLLEVEFKTEEEFCRLWYFGEIRKSVDGVKPSPIPEDELYPLGDRQEKLEMVRNTVGAAIADAIEEDLLKQPEPL